MDNNVYQEGDITNAPNGGVVGTLDANGNVVPINQSSTAQTSVTTSQNLFLPGLDSGLGVTPQSQGASPSYGGATTSTAPNTSGSWNQFTSWLGSEKYNASAIVVGVLMVILGIWRMLGESGNTVVNGIGEGA